MITDEKIVFEGKTFSDLLKDIYNNSEKKKKQIDILIRELTPLVKTVNEAAVIVPLIKEYLDVGVRNDEQLVKMASVYQKYISAEKKIDAFSPSGGILTREEKEQLLTEVATELFASENLNEKDIALDNKNLDELLQKTQSTVNLIKEETLVSVNGEG